MSLELLVFSLSPLFPFEISKNLRDNKRPGSGRNKGLPPAAASMMAAVKIHQGFQTVNERL